MTEPDVTLVPTRDQNIFHRSGAVIDGIGSRLLRNFRIARIQDGIAPPNRPRRRETRLYRVLWWQR
jgi:hypothetical protein